MWIYVIIGIVLLIIIYGLYVFNSFVKLNNIVKEAFSTMDVYLKKRWDLIPNIVETVKEYSAHEKDTLQSVVNLKNKSYDAMSIDDKIIQNEKLTKNLLKIMALAENYPDLKANQSFYDLSRQLIKIEEDIANSRKYYNGSVRIFNNKVEMFPSNIFARILAYKTKKMFEAEASERKNINIEL